VVRLIVFLFCFTLLWAEYAPNKILIQLKPQDSATAFSTASTGLDSRLVNLLNTGGTDMPEIRKVYEQPEGVRALSSGPAGTGRRMRSLENWFVVEYPATVNVELLIEMLKTDASVQHAQPVYTFRIMTDIVTPDVRYYENETFLGESQKKYMDQISANFGWAITTGSPSTIVAVIDTGISMNHRDFSAINFGFGKIFRPRNFLSGIGENPSQPHDDHGHGTHVAGLIAARAESDGGIIGLDWNARIMPLRVMRRAADGRATGGLDAILAAITYAVDNGAHIINMSLGVHESAFARSPRDLEIFRDVIHEAAVVNGVILVASMGNSNVSGSEINYPAGFPEVISVGSVNSKFSRSSFSTYGRGSRTTELVAPGGDIDNGIMTEGILSAYHAGNGYELMPGTSMAAPLVSGLCSLLLAVSPNITSVEVRNILHNTAGDLGSSGYDVLYGHGIINVYRALTRTPTPRVIPTKLTEVLSFPNPAKYNLRFSFRSDKDIESVSVVIYDQRGRKVTELSSGPGMSGYYSTPYFDLKVNDKYLANGSYIYVVRVKAVDGTIGYGRNVLTVVR